MRAIAAIGILVVHAAIFSGGLRDTWYQPLVAHLDIGVTLFFLLSGFLLYRPFLASRILGTPGVRTRDYARRRFLRIAPAYWVALTIVAIVPGMYGIFSGDWWVYYGLLQNYPLYDAPTSCVNADLIFRCGIPPTWTLGIEVFFYALLPLFAFVMARLARKGAGARWFATELLVLLALSVVSVFIQSQVIDTDLEQWLFFSPLGRAWWFGLGMALAAVSVRITQQGRENRGTALVRSHPGSAWALAAILYCGACLFVLDPHPSLGARFGISALEYVGEYILFGVIAALVLLPAVFESPVRALPAKLLAHPALAWLGLVSYGIFLWHYPVLVALDDIGLIDWWPSAAFPLTVLATLAVTLVLAALSYRFVELPLMRRK